MTAVSKTHERVIPFIFSDGPERQLPLPMGVGDGGRVRDEGVTLAEGWPHLGRGAMLCLPARMLDKPTSKALPIPSIRVKGTEQGPSAATPLLCL